MTSKFGLSLAKALLLVLFFALGSDALLISRPSAQILTPAPQTNAAAFNDCESEAVCPLMIAVPAGSFMAGSPDTELGREQSEGPRSVVEIRSFAVSVYEVTFEQWETCVREGGCTGYTPDDRNWGRGRQPVINVSWTDADEYVQWLAAFTGEPYRLLTEIEWEYAARAGADAAFSFGPNISPSLAQYDWSQSYRTSATRRTVGRPTAVGSFAPNAFGLYDMHGNVWEWVEDCWAENYAGHEGSSAAYIDDLCAQHVLRGGSWFDRPAKLRAAQRSKNYPWMRFSLNGIRVARDLE